MTTTSDYLEEKERLEGEEPGWAHGCVMGRKDWLFIVCRLVPGLTGCKVGTVGRYAVACDTSMEPTASRWYYNREAFEDHLTRLP